MEREKTGENKKDRMEGTEIRGLELSRRFYEACGREMIRREFSEYEDRIAAGLAGQGSECFGYDDEVSRDHDFGPGFCLWLTEADGEKTGFRLMRAYQRLPEEFLGIRRQRESLFGNGRTGVMTIGQFYSAFTGCGGAPQSPAHWLALPEHALACAVSGEVFSDPLGEFSEVRRILKKGYPEDVRLKKIAARAALMAQSGQYNYARCLKHGEPAAARLALDEFARHCLSMAFLLNNSYMPYYKWAFRRLRELPRLSELSEKLSRLLGAGAEAEPEPDRRNIKTEVLIEEICRDVIEEMRRQGLTDGGWDYLEPHALQATERIRDVNLRTMHLMDGV